MQHQNGVKAMKSQALLFQLPDNAIVVLYCLVERRNQGNKGGQNSSDANLELIVNKVKCIFFSNQFEQNYHDVFIRAYTPVQTALHLADLTLDQIDFCGAN